MPPYLLWLHYASFFNYGYEVLCVNELDGMKLDGSFMAAHGLQVWTQIPNPTLIKTNRCTLGFAEITLRRFGLVSFTKVTILRGRSDPASICASTSDCRDFDTREWFFLVAMVTIHPAPRSTGR